MISRALFLAGMVALATPSAALAEAKELPSNAPPLLKVETFDTSWGPAHRSFVLGYPVRGDIGFVTDGNRDTRREGYGPQKNK